MKVQVCPVVMDDGLPCAEKLQATVTHLVWYDCPVLEFEDGVFCEGASLIEGTAGWEKDGEDAEVRFYCANDHLESQIAAAIEALERA